MTRTLGLSIKAARLRKALKQRDIAEHLGVTRAAVGQWEAGTNEPSSQNLMKLNELLSLDLLNSSLEDKRNNSFVAMLHKSFKTIPGVISGPRKGFSIGVSKMITGDRGIVKTLNHSIISEWVRDFDIFRDIPNVYAVVFYTRSMSPKYEMEDIAYIDPDLEPTVGDYGVFTIRPQGDAEASDQEIFRRLIFRDERRMILSTLKPEQGEEFAAEQVISMSRAIREAELFQDSGK